MSSHPGHEPCCGPGQSEEPFPAERAWSQAGGDTLMRRYELAKAPGFTLIELLVALAVFAVMATLAFGGLGEAVTQSERLDEQQQRWHGVQRAVRLMESDFAQMRARPVRGILGQDHEPALEAFGAGELSFTRGGWLNPGLLPRSELQRVRYRLIEGRLLREYWPVLDRIGATEAGGEVLLPEVEAFRVEFLPESGAQQAAWTAFWPPPGEFSVATLPAGVRITVLVPGVGTVSRLIEVSR